MATYTVEITVKIDSGSIGYDAAALHVNKGDFVKWRHDQGPFALLFSNRSPFETVVVSGSIATDCWLCNALEVTGAPGVYHYQVAAAVGDRAYIDATCPAIIIK